MHPTEFRFTQDGTVLSDDPALREVLPEALGRVLMVGKLPIGLPLVGHCRVGDRWCVFTRDPGERVIRGVALEAAAYAELGYDPFRAAAAHLGGRAVTEAVEKGPTQPPASGRAADASAPLRAAYEGFLAGEQSLRRAPFLSALPAGVASEISPLSRLTAEPGPAPHRTGPSWASQPLDRTAGSSSALAPTQALPTPGGDALEDRLDALERRLAGTRRAFAAGFVVALLLGLAGGLFLDQRINGLSASSVKLTTLAKGLGVEAPPAELERTVQAHLHDLSTAAVQSGAWQAVLARRDVEPGPFLNDLVDLSQRKDQLLALASQSDTLASLAGKAKPLTSLAPAAADLVALGGAREPLLELAKRQQPLDELAIAAPQLTKIAPASDQLWDLAGVADQLQPLAASSHDLVRLAGERTALSTLASKSSALEALAARATPIQTMVEHGADLMIFWERYGAAMESLAKEQVSLAMLAERYRSIERLVQDGPSLHAVAESEPLQSLVKRPDDLRALDSNLGNLLELAEHADALLSRVGASRRAVPSQGG